MEESPRPEHNDLTKEKEVDASKQTEIYLHLPRSHATFLELVSNPGLCMMYSGLERART